MRRVHRIPLSCNSAAWRLPILGLILALMLATADAARAQRAPAAGNITAAATTYRVVNLGADPLSALPKINARGQVSFSLNPGAGSRGFFYNGKAVQDIGTLGGAETLAVDLNEAGQVTGGSILARGSEHAFVWTAGGGMRDIGVLPESSNARAAAINRHGVVTGTSEAVPDFPPRAFRWSAAGGMENLGALAPGSGSFSSGTALNDAGLITGSSTTADLNGHAFAWTRAGGLLDIDTLAGLDSIGVAVGAGGHVAGNVIRDDSFLYHAFLWTPGGGMKDLGTSGGTESFVTAMSPGLQIAGIINLADGTQRAMSWIRSEGMRSLGTLGGATSFALGINGRGQIVGLAENRTGEARAFAWTAQGGMVDLNTLLRNAPPGLVLDNAIAINDNGAIVATSNAGLVLLKPRTSNKSELAGGPAVGPLVVPGVARAGVPLQATVAFVDEDRAGTRSVSWSWGDGSGAQAGRVAGANGGGSASSSHSFAAPGIYRVAATVTDGSGRGTSVSRTVVVAAPSSGTVAGTGAIMSPPGALKRSPSHAGPVSFILIAPSTAGARAAGMPARLQFDLPGWNFRSDSIRLLGRQGAQHVFEGSGTIQGRGGYRFRLATDAGAAGGAGRFGLKIWHTDPASKAEVVDYDNGRAPAAARGSRLSTGSVVLD
ncbi:PKD domain-containing protein [Telluria aromaticivorans]|nr:PKD domain-containing protein [Telluria aromaticivorans]